jgi:hypothetical protein
MELVRSCGCIFIQSLLVCVQSKMQAKTEEAVCLCFPIQNLLVHLNKYPPYFVAEYLSISEEISQIWVALTLNTLLTIVDH